MQDSNKNSIENLKKHMEDITKIAYKPNRLEALINLGNRLREKERRPPISFKDFSILAAERPTFVFRDIFQLFYDMIHHYIPAGKDEFQGSDSIGFLNYDTTNLFVKGCDNPFFADQLFSNRLMNMVDSFKQGTLNNHIFLFEGPPGSGKSTFLNNLLLKLEEYTRTPQGAMYKTYWRLDIEKLGGFQRIERRMHKIAEQNENSDFENELDSHAARLRHPSKFLEFSCPRHDHPIIQIPKQYRKKYLDELILNGAFKEKLFHSKEYEWVLRDIPCSICRSLFETLLEYLGDPMEVFNMIYARKIHFNRQFGEGITIFNPGDPVFSKPITNLTLQQMINDLLKSDDVEFVFSVLAKTNNGVFALMDIKEHNVERLMDLHGIISDGVHKVELTEERIKSLFVGLVNPEDRLHYEKIQSFQDRIITLNVPYVLDYNTEVMILKNKFGKNIESAFLPGVLENFAKIIISSRLNKYSPTINNWITDNSKYSKYLDKNSLLLKMDLYTGKIPAWLSEDDVKKFTFEVRKSLLAESESEGNSGFSGRQALTLFNNFFSKYAKPEKLITMEMVRKFFSRKEPPFNEIPEGFIESLEEMYNYNVLQEVKESIYSYNEKQISKEIENYLFAINFDPGSREISPYTGDVIEITDDFFRNFEMIFLGNPISEERRKIFRKDVQSEYITVTLSQEIRIEGKQIWETQQYKSLFEKYTRNLKENALTPYLNNENFRRSILDFGTPAFLNYDDKLKRDVTLLITNLKNKFKYNLEGAKQVSIYVLDKKLAEKYQ